MDSSEEKRRRMPKNSCVEDFGDGFRIRPAAADDVSEIVSLVREIADYEKLTHEMVADDAEFHEALFGGNPSAESVIAELNGCVVGYAIFFHNFSTFLGRRGLYLEDLYLRTEFRKRGFGRLILRYLAKLARKRKCGRFEWSALDWNTPAINAYLKIGATPMDEWTIFRLSEDGIANLAELELQG